MNSSPFYLALLLASYQVSVAQCSLNNTNSTKFSAKKSNLLMAQAIFRHGDRNPIRFYAGDRWSDLKYWPEGLNKLTKIGKQQVYKLGQWLRNRYEKQLFPNGFCSDEVQIFCSDIKRAMMSASACSAGLFPPAKEQILNNDLHWQPVPIYTIARDVDTMILRRRPCNTLYNLYMEFLNSTMTMKKMKNFQKTFDVLKKYCGADVANMNGAASIYDTLQIEMLKNKTIPFWAKRNYRNLKKIAEFQKFSNGATPQLARLNGGFLIKEIVDNFFNKIDKRAFEKRNFILISGHDATIVAALTALSLYDMELPPYASCMLFELHESGGEHFIRIFYRKKPTDNVQPLYIPNCGFECPLKKIPELYKAVIPTKSFDEECKNYW